MGSQLLTSISAAGRFAYLADLQRIVSTDMAFPMRDRTAKVRHFATEAGMLGRTGLMLATAVGLLGAGVAAAAVPAAEFVKKAGASDLYEEQSSKLVLATTKDPKIKSFANMMIADHMKTTSGVKAAVQKSGMAPKPAMLEPEQRQMIAALKAKSGTARDALYVQQQKMSHQEALMLMQDYSSSGDNPNLKQAATTAVPIVQSHVDKLAAM